MPYYAAVPGDGGLVVPADPFLGAGSALAVYPGATPAGAATEPTAKLQAPATPANMTASAACMADYPMAIPKWPRSSKYSSETLH